ncbi:MAG: pectate lyase [Chitinophagaceae bacterium]|nr:pectate lyase [Chitinophagaceae bacterium]
MIRVAYSYRLINAALLMLVVQASFAQKQAKPVPPLYVEKGQLQYKPDTLGNRIPDFSYCGYKASVQAIPVVPAKVYVPLSTKDATDNIQLAIDYVSGMPKDAQGFRGAVQLLPGEYKVSGSLRIDSSGVVLRGSGAFAKGTRITGTGTSRETLLRLLGEGKPTVLHTQAITDKYVPVNSNVVTVADVAVYQVGHHVRIHRPSTAAWIQALGTDHFGGGITALGWKPGERDLFFDRTITAIRGHQLELDAPITTALDVQYGSAFVQLIQWPGRITQSGVENLQLVSAYNKANAKDEDHRWDAIGIENAVDCWVRQVSFQHFAGSAVRVLETAQRITVEDCIATQPISEIGGQRRYTFFTSGQQTLFQRCYAENGYHDFAAGFCAAGPNAFVQCESILPYSFSGAIDSWASGVLMDVVAVDGNALRFGNRGQDANGAGWAAANCVFWNSSAARIDCYQPPTAQNWAFGSWSQFAGDGYWNESNNTIQPRSLYYAQLQERLKKDVAALARLMPVSTEASSSPSVAVALQLSKEAMQPKPLLKTWIEAAAKRNALPVTTTAAPSIADIVEIVSRPTDPFPVTQLKQGVLVRDGHLLAGKRTNVQWWSGSLSAKDIANAKPHLTRFVPGRYGKGLTDNIKEVAVDMKATGTVMLEHNYGLWYDRRRDDHQRVRRMDGEVWPPFYEQPFARSGQGTAWDGLSKYDLTKYNAFYWSRLQSFANAADANGLVLLQQHYFQHNIIEAGAHYADFPWRTANNINNTGFVEPVNYAGDKRIFYAEQFYDISHPVRRALHRQYIRQCLNNFSNNHAVIHSVSEEYTGPLHFVQFWLDVIAEWKKETGKQPLIALSITKDVQDSILANPKYAALINIIDIRYWHYQADGTLYAPAGGVSLAPRQHARLQKPKKTSFGQVYRAVLEYKQKFPEKAVMYSGDNYPEFGIAVLMAGGSLPVLPANIDAAILEKAVGMKPVPAKEEGVYILSNGKASIVYNGNTHQFTVQD